MARSKLALVDGHAVAFRAFHALRDAQLRTSDGEPTFAVFGFLQIVLTTLQQLQPEYLAVSFDVGRTFRDDLYAEYKAGRAETPDDFHPQLRRIQQVVRALNIPIYTVEGYEADDVIGTLSRQATKKDVETYIITGDSDTLQLVDEHVRVLLAVPYGRKQEAKEYDLPAVIERYKGLRPEQLADLRGLKGDATDNIPGVRGIGETGAIQLLLQYQTVEGIYDHLDQVPNRYRKALDGQREAAIFSKKLATIHCDVPIELKLEDCRVAGYDRDAVIALFQELQFGSLLRKLPASDGSPAEQTAAAKPSAAPGTPQQIGMFDDGDGARERGAELAKNASNGSPLGTYRAVRTPDELAAMLEQLQAADWIGFDTETNSLDARTGELVGLSFAVRPGEAWYVPIGHKSEDAQPQLSREQVREALLPILEDGSKAKVGHNAKFDVLALRTLDIKVRGVRWDTMIAALLLGNQAVNLKDLAFNVLRLSQPMTEISSLIGSGRNQISFDYVPVELAAPYAAADADMTLRLRERFDIELDKQPRVRAVFEQIEMPLLPVLVDMEWYGIKVDVDVLKQLGDGMQRRIGELEAEIFAIAEGPFNIGSGQQLNQVLFERLKLPTEGLSRTKTGLYSITAEVLDRLSNVDPTGIVSKILEYRQLTKLKSTYLDAIPGLVDANSRVHTEFKQIGSATGRLACLPAGTLVNTHNGLVTIDTVRPGDLIRTPYGPRRVLDWQATGIKPVVALRLSNGITLRCSPEHQLRSVGSWIEAAKLEAGMPVYMSYVRGMFGGKVDLAFSQAAAFRTRKTPQLPSVWTEDLAELVGYLQADGHIARSPYNGKPATVILAFGWDDQELIEHFSNSIGRLFGKKPTYRITRTCPVLELSSVDVAGMFEQLGAGGKSGVIRVPSSLFHAPKRIVAAFLRGYFEGDGSAHKVGIFVRSTSRAMLEDVHHLLVVFGIPSAIKNGAADPRGYAPRHTLYLRGDRSKKVFADEIGFLTHRKQRGCEALYNTSKVKSHSELLSLPAGFDISHLKPAIYASVRGANGRLPTDALCFTSKLVRGKTTLTLPRAEWVVEKLPFDYVDLESRYLREIVAAQYYEVHVKDVVLEEPVPMYDIAVEEVEQYVAQGIVVHNSTNPNLMNIPVRTEQGREIRRAFVAEPGYCLLSADYSQMELRLLAHLTQDPPLLQVFREGRDIHAATAARLFGVPESKVSKNQRRIAKTVQFGTIYGISSFGLSARTELNRQEAQQLIDGLFATYPGLKKLFDRTLAFGREHGYVETAFGRRRYFGSGQSNVLSAKGPQRAAAEREAINAPIQGTSADLVKMAMIRLWDELNRRGLGARLLLQVHDELLLEVPDDELDEVKQLVREVMEHVYPELSVPLEVGISTGRNWEEMG